nr:MAG TPA: LysW biosynthesis protein LysW [Caudoviricetes sp.]
MNDKPPLFLIRCPYCGNGIGLATQLEIYHSKFWCNKCSRGVTVDPLRPDRFVLRKNNKRYYDI